MSMKIPQNTLKPVSTVRSLFLPMVSKISARRENAVSALGITIGARDMDSTPPASTTSASRRSRLQARGGFSYRL